MAWAQATGVDLQWELDGVYVQSYKDQAHEDEPHASFIYTKDGERFCPVFDIPRDDPALLEAFNQHQDLAPDLKVIEIPEDIKWSIGEADDGREWVFEQHRTWY